MKSYMDEIVELVDLSQNRPLNQIVYEGLKTAILSGIIPVGDHINEKVYASYLNISRTPMRKAIKRLEDEEILTYIPNYGVVVKKVTIADAEEIYKIRNALDTLAAITAMHLMGEEEYKIMEELLEKTKVAHANGEIRKTIEYFSDFNALIYRFAKMPRLKTVVAELREYLSRFRDISLLDDERRKEALMEHGIIFDCLKTKDEETVKIITEEHLNHSKDFVINEIIQHDKAMEEMFNG